MEVGTYKDVEFSLPAGPGNDRVRMRVLIGEKQGAPNFVMRHFELLPGGSTPYHSHAWEHELFVISGRGTANQEGVETPIERGSFVYVAPGEMHNFSAAPDSSMELLCIIPREDKCSL